MVFAFGQCERVISCPFYSKRQYECSISPAMTLAILLQWKSMGLLENGTATRFGATPSFSIRVMSQASS